MNSLHIDITGDDIFAKGYGFIITLDEKEAFAYKPSSPTQKDIRDKGREEEYGFKVDRNFKPRIYTSVVYLMLEKIYSMKVLSGKDVKFFVCRDFFGYDHYISDRLVSLMKNKGIGSNICKKNFEFCKHPKSSLVQQTALKVSRGNWEGVNKIHLEDICIHNTIAKKKSNQ